MSSQATRAAVLDAKSEGLQMRWSAAAVLLLVASSAGATPLNVVASVDRLYGSIGDTVQVEQAIDRFYVNGLEVLEPDLPLLASGILEIRWTAPSDGQFASDGARRSHNAIRVRHRIPNDDVRLDGRGCRSG